ncbi:MAG TPA: helix-turn-helix transcriptional regulator [Roseiflexaceae bacterium]|nr:helix-turn-helix transcriptional regulator [Roseiflexaceae bacterium]
MKVRLRVGELMKERGMSIQDLADQAGIAYNTARGMYHGITTRIDLPVLERVAEALGVPPLDLFEQSETEEELLALHLVAA